MVDRIKCHFPGGWGGGVPDPTRQVCSDPGRCPNGKEDTLGVGVGGRASGRQSAAGLINEKMSCLELH